MDTEQHNPQTQAALGTPIAIVIAGAFVAAALYFGGTSGTAPSLKPETRQDPQQANKMQAVEPVTSSDHIRGDKNAPVVIVEYADFECPFCKRFHGTVQQIVSEYGEKVAWVYRHFPLDQLHAKARREAVASECANELGGNDAFWAFTDRFYELTPSNDQTDIETVLPQIAREIGLNEAAFRTCLTSGKYDTHVEENYQNAVATGGTGTPWSIVIGAGGKKYPISGSLPYESVKSIIEQALAGK